jgi:hypothetical protein
MRPTIRLTYLAFELNHLLDRGLSTDLSETKRRVDDGTVLDWLSRQYGPESGFGLDLSLYSDEDRRGVLDLFASLLSVTNERRKMGVENNGLCLLLGYCIEGVQQSSGGTARPDRSR